MPKVVPVAPLADQERVLVQRLLALDLRTPGAEVVIDNLAGRRCALAMGLRVHGTLGVVIESYRLGKLTDPRATMLS